ncbi:phosphopantetheine-binding protein [Prevotella sp. KH2C16]|uniref:phosphopantetheine-binding protein n=1 Tax=Prevotella sp. KH2C16 TaxID=1855325 RepID=UPI002101067A|nr:phosphopantetheine-binding protein [Prevotella sp. KH2C16]
MDKNKDKNMELQEELKTKILKALNLEELKPEDVDNDAPLFGEDGIGLDSIDALELIVLLEKDYGIRIKDPKAGKEIFKSIHVMADYVAANRKK